MDADEFVATSMKRVVVRAIVRGDGTYAMSIPVPGRSSCLRKCTEATLPMAAEFQNGGSTLTHLSMLRGSTGQGLPLCRFFCWIVLLPMWRRGQHNYCVAGNRAPYRVDCGLCRLGEVDVRLCQG